MEPSAPEHGGRLDQAIQQWGIPRHQWLDLSTGINPRHWPIPDIPAEVWQRLPEDGDGLPSSILRWCEAPAKARCLPVAGSQAAIQTLPRLRSPCRVGIPVPGYREHGYWWQKAGHTLVPIELDQLRGGDQWLDNLDGLVWINPNNPTGLSLPVERLLEWHHRLQAKGGFLVVDEAFVEKQPGYSMAPFTGVAGLVVLRSLGKFFGLAGIRAGAVLSDGTTVSALAEQLGPWAMSGPARFIMKQALEDLPWQQAAARELAVASDRLHRLLMDYGYGESTGTALFRYLPHSDATRIYRSLASRGILVRHFERPQALRFGLPAGEPEWQRLADALAECH
ncbi:threonine-phosphate decarboxylase [Marinobacter salinexigens]|uniref:threonine-phosphate decarboxylase n=1 Tax=Marinobacter salinexigens TaxID=2919747 RepID=A0A5B0VIN3_9GAMM|nr:threonine-phosphate decarboxylase CobD [Marinobacter salinexigens]KAA1174512.1 threonine-phosphate decarboxylase [Marinobacter salinexigens]